MMRKEEIKAALTRSTIARTSGPTLTVGALKRALEGLPDDMEVFTVDNDERDPVPTACEPAFLADDTVGFVPEGVEEYFIDAYLTQGCQPIFVISEK